MKKNYKYKTLTAIDNIFFKKFIITNKITAYQVIKKNNKMYYYILGITESAKNEILNDYSSNIYFCKARSEYAPEQIKDLICIHV